MAFTTQATIVGNVTRDPELRHTSAGKPVVNLSVASTPGAYNRETKAWEEGQSVFIDCSAWDEMAENIAASLGKGSRVIVTGTFKASTYKDREGNERTKNELQISEIGHTLRFHTTRADKRGKSAPPQQNSSAPGTDVRASQDQWAQSSGYTDEVPW
jgi:single-strand DNA-binding protein